MAKQLILGSTSIYRQAILEKLHIPFTTAAPDIDETRLATETASEMVLRLSLAKAKAVSNNHKGEQGDSALIIGSDQCAVLGEQILGKPGTHENAVKQLQASSGKTVSFLTGLCLYDTQNDTYQLDLVPYAVEFRTLSDAEIEAYLTLEQPYNCAGSFKSEGLGISLFNSLQGNDPNALIGLPLIRLAQMLRQHSFNIPG